MISAPLADNLAALPRLPRDEDGPVFAEPWQAQAFALAVRLSAQGHFTWKEWAAALAEELKADAERGEPDDGSRYYHCWLTTLERLVVAKRLSDAASAAGTQRRLGRRLSPDTARQARRAGERFRLLILEQVAPHFILRRIKWA